MHGNQKIPIGKIVVGGLVFFVFYWIVVFLYGSSLPSNSGLAGAFAVGFFALGIAVFLPVIIGFVLFLDFLGKKALPKQPETSSSSQPSTENKGSKDVSTLKMIFLITLFPLLFFFLMSLINALVTFDGSRYYGDRELKPTGEYHYTLPGNPSVIKTY